MSNLGVLDLNGADKFLKASGAGTDIDPHIVVHDVNIQDQTSPIIIEPFHREIVANTVAVATAVDDRDVTVTDATGFAVDQRFSMYNIAGGRWYNGFITNIVANLISLDTPIDFAYQIGDQASGLSIDLNVDGSVTPVTFTIRSPDPGIPVVGDITRIILILETTLAPEMGLFGDLAKLTNGIVLRKVDGTVSNILNAKSNAGLMAHMYDLDFLDATKFGTFGVKGRMTFAGQNKMGVVIRLEIGDDLELIVQDDLTGLVDFRIIAEGHVVV